MDPWKDCKRIGEDHFMDRVLQRSFNLEILDDILTAKDNKQPLGAKDEDKQDFLIKGKGWVIKATLTKCTLTLRTVHRE